MRKHIANALVYALVSQVGFVAGCGKFQAMSSGDGIADLASELQLKPCSIANGTGRQRGQNGTCMVQSCNAGYTAYNNACYQSVQSCAVATGTGSQTFNSTTGTYGTCEPTACSSGYHVDATTRLCVADTFQNVQLIEIAASDNVGVTKVEVFINKALLCTLTAAPYNCKWPVVGNAGDRVLIEAKAYDVQGNVGLTASTVTLE
jgi:hypothetical protein